MRYIRTENEIFEVIDENDRYYRCINPQISWATIKSKIENDENGIDYVIAESNTIEKLCDEFVLVVDYSKIGKNNEHIIIKNNKLEYFKLLTNVIKNSTIFGAIWTSKGLIYVAKMNSEGKLVLI